MQSATYVDGVATVFNGNRDVSSGWALTSLRPLISSVTEVKAARAKFVIFLPTISTLMVDSRREPNVFVDVGVFCSAR